MEAGKDTLSIQDYAEAIRLNPRFSRAYINRSHFYNRTSHYSESIEDSTTVIGLDPDDTNAHVNRGIAYTFLGRPVDAEADFFRAVKLGYDRAEIDREIEEIRRLNEESE